MSFANSNQIVAFQAINKSSLALSPFPREKAGTSGHYIKPAMMMSISSKSKSPEEAAKIISFMVQAPEGVKILGIERGVPCSTAARATLLPDLDALGKIQIDYVASVGKTAIPLPPPPPKGAGEIENLLRRVADSVAFGKTSIADGAAQFHAETIRVLARSA
jgi:multiple sugar transport system substrate-binding protein